MKLYTLKQIQLIKVSLENPEQGYISLGFNTTITSQLLIGKLVPAIELLKPTWVGKLITDF